MAIQRVLPLLLLVYLTTPVSCAPLEGLMPNTTELAITPMEAYRALPKIEKSNETRAIISLAMKQNVNFDILFKRYKKSMIDAMFPVEKAAGENVFLLEGEQFYLIYVLESGVVDVYKNDTLISSIYSGTLFGEFCITGLTPELRFIAHGDVKLWALDLPNARRIRTAINALTPMIFPPCERGVRGAIRCSCEIPVKNRILNSIDITVIRKVDVKTGYCPLEEEPICEKGKTPQEIDVETCYCWPLEEMVFGHQKCK